MNYDTELISAKLSRLHNDILGLHLTMVMDRLHTMGLISDDKYIELLNKEHQIISDQLKRKYN